MHFQKLQDIVKENQSDPYVYASTYSRGKKDTYPYNIGTMGMGSL